MRHRGARGERSEYEGSHEHRRLAADPPSSSPGSRVRWRVPWPWHSARDNHVIGAARFTDSGARTELEAAGVECVPVDLVEGDVAGLPADAEYVLNFAVAKTNDWDRDLAANSGGLASLMEHHQGARAFLHCSSTAVYKPEGHRVFAEDGPLGDNHGVWPFLRTYSICKIAAEETARWCAQRFEPADDDRPALGALRRQRRLAGHPPPHDAVG